MYDLSMKCYLYRSVVFLFTDLTIVSNITTLYPIMPPQTITKFSYNITFFTAISHLSKLFHKLSFSDTSLSFLLNILILSGTGNFTRSNNIYGRRFTIGPIPSDSQPSSFTLTISMLLTDSFRTDVTSSLTSNLSLSEISASSSI